MPSGSNEACHYGNSSGDKYNAMIAPYSVGPMNLAGAIWYQVLTNQHRPRSFLVKTLSLTDSLTGSLAHWLTQNNWASNSLAAVLS